jgi:hypothetical protein
MAYKDKTRRHRSDGSIVVSEHRRCVGCSSVEDIKAELQRIVVRLRRENPAWSLTRSWVRAQVEHMKGHKS